MFILSDSRYVDDTYIIFWSKNSKETPINCKYHEYFRLFLHITLLCKIQSPVLADRRLDTQYRGLVKNKIFFYICNSIYYKD